MRCICGIQASSYIVERWSLSFSTTANTPAGVSRPVVPVEEGVANFVDWYREYYRVR